MARQRRSIAMRCKGNALLCTAKAEQSGVGRSSAKAKRSTTLSCEARATHRVAKQGQRGVRQCTTKAKNSTVRQRHSCTEICTATRGNRRRHLKKWFHFSRFEMSAAAVMLMTFALALILIPWTRGTHVEEGSRPPLDAPLPAAQARPAPDTPSEPPTLTAEDTQSRMDRYDARLDEYGRMSRKHKSSNLAKRERPWAKTGPGPYTRSTRTAARSALRRRYSG